MGNLSGFFSFIFNFCICSESIFFTSIEDYATWLTYFSCCQVHWLAAQIAAAHWSDSTIGMVSLKVIFFFHASSNRFVVSECSLFKNHLSATRLWSTWPVSYLLTNESPEIKSHQNHLCTRINNNNNNNEAIGSLTPLQNWELREREREKKKSLGIPWFNVYKRA